MENENLKNQETNSIEQKPINSETDWIIKNVDKDFESLSPEKKQEALDNLRKELESKYDMIAPDMNFGAKNVEKETGIVKKEQSKESAIQARGETKNYLDPNDELLKEHLDKYSKEHFDDRVAQGELNKFSDEMMEKSLKGEDVSGFKFSREQFLNDYFKKYFKENAESGKFSYPEGKGIESIPEDEREAIQEEAIKEFERIQEQSKNQNIETKEFEDNQGEVKKKNWAERINELKKSHPDSWADELRKEFDEDKFKNESKEIKEKILEYDKKPLSDFERTQQDNIEAQSKDQTSYQEQLKEIQKENDAIKENIQPREFSYPEGKGIESIPEDEREALQEEAIKEFEAIKEQSENQEGFKEQLKTLEKMENNESFEEDELSAQEEAQKQETDGQRRLRKIGKGLQAVGGWVLGKAFEFVVSLPAKWYDLTSFLFGLSESILDGNPGSYIQKFLNKRLNAKQKQWEASLYGER